MTRSTFTGVLGLLAVLTLTACSAPAAPAGDDASPPAAESTSATPDSPAESPSPTPTPTPSADAADGLRSQCESVVMSRFGDRSPRLATDADFAAFMDEFTVVLPGTPTCGVVSGDETFTFVAWIDQPLVAPELTRVLDARGWAKSQEQATGYVITVYDAASAMIAVGPVGVDNAMSVWGQPWPGLDVTLLTVDRS